jgi:hypothetical protein
MHKTFLLSKEVDGVHELYWNFWNNQLIHNHPFFHGTYHLPLVLIFLPSSFVSAIDLISATLKHLFDFSLSSVTCSMLCSSALLSSGFLPFLLTFISLLFPCVHWILSLHYQLWYSILRPPYLDWRFPHLLPFPQYASRVDVFRPLNYEKCARDHFVIMMHMINKISKPC